jgi:transposase
MRNPVQPGRSSSLEPTNIASAGGFTLRSSRVGSLPIINRILERMRLGEFLDAYLQRTGRESKIPTRVGIEILLRNVLLAREPLYGVGEWASQYAPHLLGLEPGMVSCLNDDRVGRCLDRLFDADRSSLVLSVVGHVVREFGVNLEELHNDSTTISFFGQYEEARPGRRRRGKSTLAILFGNSKAHRPDLKQLLFILTVSRDGGVPIHFEACDGNTADDTTHRRTWDLLCELSGTCTFLYVADCKLASKENMMYIHRKGGRFITVLPRTRSEDKDFREKIGRDASSVLWKQVHEVVTKDGVVLDSFRIADEPGLSAEGFRLLWFHSSRKAELDRRARAARIERCLQELGEFRAKLRSPRTRYRDPVAVIEKVEAILSAHEAAGLLAVEVKQVSPEIYHQAGPGRPGPKTRYRREQGGRFDLIYEIDTVKLAAESLTDGIFPLVTNQSVIKESETKETGLTEKEVLLAYKRQPLIEKRFAQLKTDYEVAPVYLKEVGRIEAFFTVYFLALLVQALIEREARSAMRRDDIESLPLYPEDRDCKAPSARRILDVFDNVQRHELVAKGEVSPVVLTTELSPLQKKILNLFEVSTAAYGSDHS